MDQLNFERMLTLIDEVFATRKDPGQIKVTARQRKKLEQIHPATLSEFADKNGPLIWILIFPTTSELMNAFLNGKITEAELLNKTKLGISYDCIYLCSATTLPECRGKGRTKKLCLKAIKEICKTHPIKTLFVWPFTREGTLLAKAVAKSSKLKLLRLT